MHLSMFIVKIGCNRHLWLYLMHIYFSTTLGLMFDNLIEECHVFILAWQHYVNLYFIWQNSVLVVDGSKHPFHMNSEVGNFSCDLHIPCIHLTAGWQLNPFEKAGIFTSAHISPTLSCMSKPRSANTNPNEWKCREHTLIDIGILWKVMFGRRFISDTWSLWLRLQAGKWWKVHKF